MKALVTTGEKRGIIVKDIPKPQVQPGTLLLKTKFCSICGSELEYLNGSLEWRGKSAELHAGAILGHEFSAEVAAVGEGVEGWSVGDRATIGTDGQGCGQCYYCQRRLYHLCYGSKPRQVFWHENIPGGFGNKNGAFAEYFVSPPSGLTKLPNSISDEEAALVEPLSVGVGAIKAAEIELRDTAVVIGAGKIGLGAMLCAKAAGVAPVIVIDIVNSRLDKALEMGADVVLNAKEVDVVSEVVKLTEEGPDAVILAVREGKVLNQAIDMVRRGGIIVLIGAVSPTEVNPSLWCLKNLRFIGTILYSPMITSLNLIANKQVNIKPLTSVIMPLEDAQKAFDSMYSGENTVVLLKP